MLLQSQQQALVAKEQGPFCPLSTDISRPQGDSTPSLEVDSPLHVRLKNVELRPEDWSNLVGLPHAAVML